MNSEEHMDKVNSEPRGQKWRFAIRAAVAAAPMSIFFRSVMPATLILDYLDAIPKGRGSGAFWLMMVLNVMIFACVGFLAGLLLDIRAHGLRRHRVAAFLTIPPTVIVLVIMFFHIPILRATMLHFLKHERVEARWEAAYGLQWMEGHARPAVPEVLAALNDEDPRVRWHLATTLSNCVRAEDMNLVERLVDMYKSDPSEHMRWHVAQLLMMHEDRIPSRLQDEIRMVQRPEKSIWGYGGGRGR